MEIARHWRLNNQRYKLQGEHCSLCNEYIFPPRDVCPECLDTGEKIIKDNSGIILNRNSAANPSLNSDLASKR
ncbi:MAG: zinc ribbon domain-containing protein [Patescibacteria group bacterium]